MSAMFAGRSLSGLFCGSARPTAWDAGASAADEDGVPAAPPELLEPPVSPGLPVPPEPVSPEPVPPEPVPFSLKTGETCWVHAMAMSFDEWRDVVTSAKVKLS